VDLAHGSAHRRWLQRDQGPTPCREEPGEEHQDQQTGAAIRQLQIMLHLQGDSGPEAEVDRVCAGVVAVEGFLHWYR
jgi:hypothetical protein